MAKKNAEELHPLADLDRLIHSPARLMVMTYLYVVESVDYVYLTHLTGLTWGNLATHVNKLEEAGYVQIEKTFVDKKPYSVINLTKKGRQSFKAYKQQMQDVFDDLPD
ncbi:MAG TPA: transcriptional regulator [Anaerolineales bacterium]|nr:transcriptional regulator [Anaerolineales bacterium]